MAAVSKNGHEGFSTARDPRNLELCAEVESKWENAENDTFHLVNDVIWESAMNGAPLIKRGWVLQERILSPRSLHFCENELFWEFREKIACETYQTGLPSICSHSSQSNIKIREPSESESYEKTHMVHETSKTKKDVAYDRWATWVVLYSRAYLTKDSDKLVAINALTKFTRTALDDVYVAGLWRSKFVDQLAWSFFHRNLRPTEYRAPSWSWASVNGEIYFASIMSNTQDQIEIDEVQVVSLSPVDVTGSVFIGFFRARGLLIHETLIQKPKYDNLFYFSGDRHAHTYVKLDMQVEKYKAPVVILPILNYFLRPEDNPSGYLLTRFQALILQPRAGSPNGFYTRIGLAQSDISFIKDERHGKLSAFRNPLRKLLRRDAVSSSKSHRFSRNEIGVNSGIDESLYLADSPGSLIVY